MLDKFVFFWQLLDKYWTPFCNNYLSVNNLYTAPSKACSRRQNNKRNTHWKCIC